MKKITVILVVLLVITETKAQGTLELDYSSPQAVHNLGGFNTGFNHRHWVDKESIGGVTSYTELIRGDFLTPVRQIGKPILRFPGGVIANFYHLYEANACIIY